jgi:hypothetical protein
VPRELAAGETGDPTPPSVRRALEVVAHHGYLTPEKLHELSPDEFKAIKDCIAEYAQAHFMAIVEAQETGDRDALWSAWSLACGRLNLFFDQETTWYLNTIPEAERESFRAKPVTQGSWRELRSRTRWHSPQRFRRDTYCKALRIRRGGQRTRRVHRRAASSPRRARAPSHLDDEPEPPLRDISPAASRRAVDGLLQGPEKPREGVAA